MHAACAATHYPRSTDGRSLGDTPMAAGHKNTTTATLLVLLLSLMLSLTVSVARLSIATAVEVCVKAAVGAPDKLGDCECSRPLLPLIF